MAPQKKNLSKTKKVAKTKPDSSKKKGLFSSSTSSKKSSTMKSGPKRADPKKIAAKNMTKGHPGGKAEKEKIASKMANKSYARKDTKGSTKATSKSGMERAERAAKRSAVKEAHSDKDPRAKKAKLDMVRDAFPGMDLAKDVLPGMDLVNLLSTSDGVADIIEVSGRPPLPAGGIEVTCLIVFTLLPTF